MGVKPKTVLSVLVVLGVATTSADCQVRGVGTRFSPSVPTGLTAFGEVGGGYDSGGFFVGGGAVANLAYTTLTGEVGRTANDDLVWGISVAANLLRGSLESFSASVQAGYGAYRSGNSPESTYRRHIPIGLGVAMEYDQAGFDIEPWVGLRGEILQSTSFDGETETDFGYGVSTGVHVRSTALRRVIGLPNKFGLHVSADIMSIPDVRSERLVVSGAFGISYGIFPMKSLPDHGIFGRRADDACGPFDPC